MERYVKAKVVLQEDQKPVTRCFFVVAETFGHAEQVIAEETGREQRTRLCTLVWGDDVEGVTELMRREKDDSEELVKVEKLNVADIIGGRP